MFQPMGFPKPRVCSLGESCAGSLPRRVARKTGPPAYSSPLHGPTGIRPLILNDQDQADVVALLKLPDGVNEPRG